MVTVTSSAVILPQMYKKVLDAERRSLGNRFGAKAAFPARNTEPCGADTLVREGFGEVFLR
jgi:hypothetical protein